MILIGRKLKTIDFWDTQIMLLKLEQVEKLSKKVLACNDGWWLCSAGVDNDSLCCVSYDGIINEVGRKSTDITGIRPAFMLLNDKVRVGDKAYVGSIRCTAIGKNLVLSDRVLCQFSCDEKSYLKPEKQLSLFVENDGFVEKYIEDSV